MSFISLLDHFGNEVIFILKVGVTQTSLLCGRSEDLSVGVGAGRAGFLHGI